jgi:hypothetical protein
MPRVASHQVPAVAGAMIEAEERAIAELASFQPAPTNLLRCVPYAWHVWQRRNALQQLELGQRDRHAQTRRMLRERIADIIDEAAATQGEVLAPLLEPVKQADQLIAARTAEAEATQGQLLTRLDQLDKELVAHAEQRKQLARDANLAQIQVEDATDKRLRADSEHARINQKIQAAHDAAQAEAEVGQEFASPEHARQIRALQTDATAAAQTLATRAAALSKAQTELRERQKAIHDLDVRVRGIQAQRSAAQNQGQVAQGQSLNALMAARDQRLDAYEAVLVTLNSEHRGLLTPEQHARTDDIYREIETNDALLERYKRAVDAYDRQSFVRGVGIAGAVALTLVVVLLVAIV